jgi:hypothetical protein
LIASAGFAVLALALGVDFARRRLLLHPVAWMGIGLTLAILSGVPGAIINESFLTHQWVNLNLGVTSLKLGTTYLFDIGVYLTVIGGVLAFLIRVQQQNSGGDDATTAADDVTKSNISTQGASA